MPRRPEPIRPFRTGHTTPSGTTTELGALLNLGPKSTAWLYAAGIRSRADLEKAGPIEACRRIRDAGQPVSVLLAYALEGALMGCHWNALPHDFKQHLRLEFAKLKREPRSSAPPPKSR